MKSKDEVSIIKEAIVKDIMDGDMYPYTYTVLQFGFFDDYGNRLPSSITNKYWDKNEVKKTCRHIKNIIREHFVVEGGIYFFLERHSPLLDEYGELIREGRYHINMLISNIKDWCIDEEPNRKLRKLMLENGSMGVPIKNMTYYDLDELKKELINAACRKADWVNRYQRSVNTQMVYEQCDLDCVIRYCLKDYDGKKLDFVDVVEFDNSDFADSPTDRIGV